jgi:hypothetical protein
MAWIGQVDLLSQWMQLPSCSSSVSGSSSFRFHQPSPEKSKTVGNWDALLLIPCASSLSSSSSSSLQSSCKSSLLFVLLLLLLEALARGGRKSRSNNTSQDEHTSMKRNKERNRHT